MLTVFHVGYFILLLVSASESSIYYTFFHPNPQFGRPPLKLIYGFGGAVEIGWIN